MPQAFVSVTDIVTGAAPIIRRATAAGISVQRLSTGDYLLTFPSTWKRLICVGTHNIPSGTNSMYVNPGDIPNPVTKKKAHLANQVRVRLVSTSGRIAFSLMVDYTT